MAAWVWMGARVGWRYVARPAVRAAPKVARGAWRGTKRGTQWVGLQTTKHWIRKTPDPSRPWTYRRMSGVPESYKFVKKGPRKYVSSKKKKYSKIYRTAKGGWKLRKRKSGGPRPQSSQQVRKGRSATAARKRGINQARRRRSRKFSRKLPWCWKHRSNHWCYYTRFKR